MNISEIARAIGVSRQAVQQRLQRGWTREGILANQPPPRAPRANSARDAECAEAGVSPALYRERRRRGWSHEDAVAVAPNGAYRGRATIKRLCDAAGAAGIARSTYYTRRKAGLSHEEALTKPRDARGRKRKVRP